MSTQSGGVAEGLRRVDVRYLKAWERLFGRFRRADVPIPTSTILMSAIPVTIVLLVIMIDNVFFARTPPAMSAILSGLIGGAAVANGAMIRRVVEARKRGSAPVSPGD